MGEPAADPGSELRAAKRQRVIAYIDSAVHGFTAMARDPEMCTEQKARINNLIHYLAGHLIGLADPKEPLTESRIDGIVELAGWLEPSLAAQLSAELTR